MSDTQSVPQTLEEIAVALRAAGAIPADAPPAPLETHDRPWFVAMLMGLAGWLAGIFLISFIVIAFSPKSGTSFFMMGACGLGAAWGLYRADREAVFLDQLALALSFAGQMALAWSFLEDVRSGLVIAATLFAVQLLVLLIMPNRTARAIAALFAVMAWVYVVRFVVLPGRGEDAFNWLERERPDFGEWRTILQWLLTWVPMLGLAWWLTMRESTWMASGLRTFARPILTGVLLAIAFGGLATEPFMVFLLGVDAMGFDISWRALFPLLSIRLALFAAGCAFRLKNLGLLGAAVFAALLHLARFYYFYGSSLTWKATIMACIGVLLLGGGLLLRETAADAEIRP